MKKALKQFIAIVCCIPMILTSISSALVSYEESKNVIELGKDYSKYMVAFSNKLDEEIKWYNPIDLVDYKGKSTGWVKDDGSLDLEKRPEWTRLKEYILVKDTKNDKVVAEFNIGEEKYLPEFTLSDNGYVILGKDYQKYEVAFDNEEGPKHWHTPVYGEHADEENEVVVTTDYGAISMTTGIGDWSKAQDYMYIRQKAYPDEYKQLYVKKDNQMTEGFTDISNSWAKDAINYVVDKGLMKGITETQFGPTGEVTNAQLATMIVRIANDKNIEIKGDAFDADDIKGHWAEDAIRKVGIYIGAEEEGKFNPDGSTTKESAVFALIRALGLDEGREAKSSTFDKIKDASDIGKKLKNAIGIAIEEGIVNGDDKGNFNPEKNITRQEIAKVIYSLYNSSLFDKENQKDNKDDNKDNTDEIKIEKWSKEAVNFAKTNKIMKGDGEVFDETRAITREELAAVIYRVGLDKGLNFGTNRLYTDVESNRWSKNYIEEVGKYIESSNKFNPTGTINKEDAVTAIVKALYDEDVYEKANIDYKTSFKKIKDGDKVTESLRDYIAYAIDHYMIDGNENSYFEPQKDMTREELAKVIWTYYNGKYTFKNIEYCTEKGCNEPLMDDFEYDDEEHWRECAEGHHILKNGHTYKDGKCEYCLQVEPKKENDKEKDEPINNEYKDVEEDRWSAKAIEYVSKKGLMSGVSNTEFAPTGTVTREQLAVVISRIAEDKKIKIKKKTNFRYDDLSFCAEWAKEAVRLVGPYVYNQDRFAPKATVTKGEAMLGLVNALNLDDGVKITSTTKNKIKKIKNNEKIDSDVEDELGVALQLSIISGDNDVVGLNNKLTREQLAKMVYAIYGGKISEPVEENSNADKDEDDSKNKDDDKEVVKPLEKCSVCGKDAEWENKETMHVLICKTNSKHVIKVGEHEIDSDNICKLCKEEVITEYELPFADNNDISSWSRKHVGYMYKKGIVKGIPSETEANVLYLRPNGEAGKITGETFIALLARALGYDGVDEISDGSVYKPIQSSWSEGEWKYLMDYMKDMEKDPEKIMKTAFSNTGRPEGVKSNEDMQKMYNTALQRERAAYILGEFLEENKLEQSVSNIFADADGVNGNGIGGITQAYRTNMSKAYSHGVFTGKTYADKAGLHADQFNHITREEAVTMIDRFRAIVEKD